MEQTTSGRVRFGPFELDPRAGELHKNGQSTVLQEQQLKVLLMLIERQGAIATREEIRKKLWPNDTVVEFDHSINNAIKNLRRLLDDSADNPKYIETIARRGYRLMVPVEWVGAEDNSAEESSADSSSDAVSSRVNPESSPGGIEGSAADDSEAIPKAKLKVGRLTGKIVSHYRVLEVIGGGGMGLVYHAEDLKLGRAVALKFLPEEVGDDPKARERFEREAHAVSALNHHNICTVYDFDEHEGHPFIAMELLQGKTLRDHLAEGRFRLTQPEGLEIAIQIAAGLEAAHEKGIIHRDIKPANIFITEKNVAKILDFGVAKVLSLSESTSAVILSEERSDESDSNRDVGIEVLRLRSSADGGLTPLRMTNQMSGNHGTPEGAPLQGPATLTRTGLNLGTAGYMSPEQIRGERLDARTDIFSFGLVLYEMATGERAFNGETEAILHDAILRTVPIPVLGLNSTLSSKLEKIIAKALEKDPEQRYQSVADMQAGLQEVDESVGVALHQRWKLMASAAVIVTATALVAGVLYWRRYNTPKLTGNDTVVLADFLNQTSDPVFDTALDPALLIELRQTPFLNLLSNAKVRETLRFLGHPEDGRLTAQLAREVCERTNSKATIEGSISDEGNRYQIEIKAVDCKTGGTLADSTRTVADRNQIVRELGEAGTSLRKKLGEPSSSLRQFNAPLDEAASASPEALQAYAAGAAQYGTLEAIPNLKRATELDPNFASAFRMLGMAYGNLDQSNLGNENLTKAFQLRQRLSRRDRFDMERRYYQFSVGDYDKAISIMEQYAQEFPGAHGPGLPLAVLWNSLGQYEKSVAAAQDLVRQAPGQAVPYDVLAESYIALDRLDEAKVVLEQAKARVPDQYQLHVDLYYLAFLQHDQNGMQEQVRWAADNPGVRDFFLAEESATQAYYGRLRKADELSRQAAVSAAKAGAPERVAESKANEGLLAAKLGETTQAMELAQQAESLNPRRDYGEIVALAFARAGDVTRALQVAEQLNRQFPMNTLVQGAYLPTIRAEVEMQRGNPASAIAMLERVAPYDLVSSDYFGLESAYIRGEAYLKAGQGQHAAAEFRKVLDHPGVVANSINAPLARVQLARAQEMMGDKEAARKSYQDFLTLWKDADPDIPIYKEAKAEYAKLMKSYQLSAVSHQ